MITAHRRRAAAWAVGLLFASRSLLAQVEFYPIDFSSRANANLDALLHRIANASGPRGEVELGGVPFVIPQGQNVWHSLNQVGPNPRVLLVPINVHGASEVHTIINSDWGRRGPGSYAYLEFLTSEGLIHRKDLVGGEDIRDFAQGQHTNTINGSSTVEVWSNGSNVRLDKQRVELPPEFRNQELVAVRVVDRGQDTTGQVLLWQRIWIAGLTVGITPPPRFRVELAQVGPRCVSIHVVSDLPFRGGELGIAFPPEGVAGAEVYPGDDLPAGAQIRVDGGAPAGCEDPTVTAGLTLVWVQPIEGPPLEEGRHDLLHVCFDLTDSVPPDGCVPLRFVSCLGDPAAPVRNVITGDDGSSIALTTVDGAVCRLPDIPFERGDANGDQAFDISDPILLLACLFVDRPCPRCADAMDANDDGGVDISDAVYLLDWRFQGGESPPLPSLECGLDPTPDEIRDCEGDTSCAG